MNLFLVTAAFAMFSLSASAEARLNSMVAANQLSVLVASNIPCDLLIDVDKVTDWIDQHVDPEDMRFANRMNLLVAGHRYNIESMQDDELQIHCHSVRRTAISLGLTADSH